jgi:hypothetical protein
MNKAGFLPVLGTQTMILKNTISIADEVMSKSQVTCGSSGLV